MVVSSQLRTAAVFSVEGDPPLVCWVEPNGNLDSNYKIICLPLQGTDPWPASRPTRGHVIISSELFRPWNHSPNYCVSRASLKTAQLPVRTQRISECSAGHEEGNVEYPSSMVQNMSWVTDRPCRWRQHVTPKSWRASTRINSVIKYKNTPLLEPQLCVGWFLPLGWEWAT